MSLADFRSSFFQLSRFPVNKVRYGVRERFIIWEGEVQPIWYTDKYTLCLNYEWLHPPRVWIVNPDLSQYTLPHVYNPGNYLCLYHPNDWQWQSSCNIIHTIIRWSQMWIVYFEDFLRNKTWRGPEANHDRPQKDNENQESTTSKTNKATTHEPIYLKDYPTRLSSIKSTKKKRTKKKGAKMLNDIASFFEAMCIMQ